MEGLKVPNDYLHNSVQLGHRDLLGSVNRKCNLLLMLKLKQSSTETKDTR